MSHSTEPTPSACCPAWRSSALVGLVAVLLALGLRWSALGGSLWVDELHTAWTVAEGAAEIPAKAAMGNQSPLYFYLVWLVTQFFGLHEWSLRLPSLAGGLLAVGLLTGAAHRWTRDAWAALAVGAVAAIDIDWIFYATEARAYALVLVVGLGQLLLAGRLLREDRFGLWVGLVVLSVGQFYLHYSTLLFTAAVGLSLLMYLPDHARRQRAIVAGICFLLGAAPSLWHLAGIFERRANWAQLFGPWSVNEWTRWGTIVLLMVPAGAAWTILRLRGRADVAERPENLVRLRFLAGAAVLTIGGAWLSTLSGLAALFAGRYLIAAEAALLLLLAAIVTQLPSVWIRRGTVCLALLLAWSFRAPGRFAPLRAEDWRGVAQAIAAQFDQAQPKPAVAIAAGLIETDLLREEAEIDSAWEEYARLPIESIYRLPEDLSPQVGLPYSRPGQLTEGQRRMLEEKPIVVVLVRGYAATADQVAADVAQSLKGKWQIDTPATQGGLVQWRVLRRNTQGQQDR